jgi:DNA end-binding protein Ku
MPELKDASQNKAQEEAPAVQLIKSLAAPFQPDEYRDTYQAGFEKLIEAKSHGKTIANVPQRTMAPVIDLMSALKKSLNESTRSQGSKTLLASVPKKEDVAKRRRKVS